MEATHRRHETSVEAELSSLFERRLGGLMLVRLELTDVLEKFKREEHALATSLRGILQLRDQERTGFEQERTGFKTRAALSQAYVDKLEYELSSRGLPLPATPPSPLVAELPCIAPRAESSFGPPAGDATEPPAATGHQPPAVLELPASPRGQAAVGLATVGGSHVAGGYRTDTLSVQALSSSFMAAEPAAAATIGGAPGRSSAVRRRPRTQPLPRGAAHAPQRARTPGLSARKRRCPLPDG